MKRPVLCGLIGLLLCACATVGEPETPDTQPDDNQEVPSQPDKPDKPKPSVVKGLTVEDIVERLGVGWNLANTLDTPSADKTAWGNPPAQQSIIDSVVAMGFTTLRVPVTWEFDMMADAP